MKPGAGDGLLLKNAVQPNKKAASFEAAFLLGALALSGFRTELKLTPHAEEHAVVVAIVEVSSGGFEGLPA